MTLWLRGVARSRDKLNPLHLHYHSLNGHQTWQDGNLPFWDPGHEVTLYKKLSFLLRISQLMSPNPQETAFFVQCYKTLWSYSCAKSYDELKPSSFHQHNFFGHQTWQDGNLCWWTPVHKATWPFDYEDLRDHVTN